jgi:hypothetical protein
VSGAAWELAQFNVAQLRAPLDSPGLADFVAALEHINALAEASPGFVWRLQDDAGDATALRPLGEAALVNMSVWRDVASVNDYVYRSAHMDYLRRRREWFERPQGAALVLWWVPAGTRPTVTEALERLGRLRDQGPSELAFTFGQPFPPPAEVPR